MDFKFFTLETLVIQTIILFIILWVLNKYLFKPYLKYLDDFEEKQKKIENDYKNIDNLLAEAEKQKEEIINEARQTSKEIVSNAENLAKKKKEEILMKAEEDSKAIIESWKAEVEKEKLHMLDQVKDKLTGLVLKFNEKLFSSEKVNKDFVEKELSQIK